MDWERRGEGLRCNAVGMAELPDDVLIRVCAMLDERSSEQLARTSRALRAALRALDASIWRRRASRWYPLAQLVPLAALSALSAVNWAPTSWLAAACRLSESSVLLSHLLDEYTLAAFTSTANSERCAELEERLLAEPFYRHVEPELLELATAAPDERLTHSYLARKIIRMQYQRRCIACWNEVYGTNCARANVPDMSDSDAESTPITNSLPLESAALVLSFWLRRFEFEREGLLIDLLNSDWLSSLPRRARVGLFNAALDVTGHQAVRTDALLSDIEQLISTSKQIALDQSATVAERGIAAYARWDELTMAAEAGHDVLEVLRRMSRRVRELLDSENAACRAHVTDKERAQTPRDAVQSKLSVVNRVFFDEFGFAACENGRYYDASNSFLDLVVLQRRGIPITLSVLYAAVARDGAQVRLHAAQVPAHFHLRVDALHLVDLRRSDAADNALQADTEEAASGDSSDPPRDSDESGVPSAESSAEPQNQPTSPPPLYIDVFHGGALRDEEGLWEFLAPMTRHQRIGGADVVHAQAVERHGGEHKDCTFAAALVRAEAAARERGVLCRFLNNLYQVYATRTQLNGFGVDMSSLRRTTGSMEGVVLQRYALSGAVSNLQVLFSLHVTRRDPDVSAHVLRRLAHQAPDFALLERDEQTLESLRQGVFGGGTAVKQRLSGTQAATVKHYVGQCVVHRRYSYEGVIVGWDSHCAAPEQWICSMQIDSLSRGRTQPFYSVLVDSRYRGPDAVTYVAEENIQLAERPNRVQHTHVPRHFAAFNPHADGGRCYVPNVLLARLYPDDVNTAHTSA